MLIFSNFFFLPLQLFLLHAFARKIIISDSPLFLSLPTPTHRGFVSCLSLPETFEDEQRTKGIRFLSLLETGFGLWLCQGTESFGAVSRLGRCEGSLCFMATSCVLCCFSSGPLTAQRPQVSSNFLGLPLPSNSLVIGQQQPQSSGCRGQ